MVSQHIFESLSRNSINIKNRMEYGEITAQKHKVNFKKRSYFLGIVISQKKKKKYTLIDSLKKEYQAPTPPLPILILLLWGKNLKHLSVFLLFIFIFLLIHLFPDFSILGAIDLLKWKVKT